MYKSMNNSPSESNSMTLTGTGQITAVVDTAVIRLGVLTTGDNLSMIQQENAQLSQAILEGLKSMQENVPLDIKTFQYTIDKLYDFENGNRIDKGFSVRNIFEIRTQQLDQVGEMIDTAVKNGANIVDLISFEVSEPEYYYNQALNLAILDAIRKAEAISSNLGILVNPVPVNIIENSSIPTPISFNLMREGASVTPIEPGNKQITAMITAKFSY